MFDYRYQKLIINEINLEIQLGGNIGTNSNV